MTHTPTLLDRPAPVPPAPDGWGVATMRRRPRRWVLISAGVLVVLVALASAALVLHRRWDDADRNYLGSDGWPVKGQASFRAGGGLTGSSPDQAPVPIASLAKVMTAYLVLRSLPLHPGSDGPTVRVTGADVVDTLQRRAEHQSLVPIRQGERLTERQALMALLLPSANNMAPILARLAGGSVGGFVGRMNATARALGMTHTRYTDPSGFDERTVSTAHDQVLLAIAADRNATFRAMVATTSYPVPVAGTVENTDTLLGHDGFEGTKTGSDDAAGGCFMFRMLRPVNGHQVEVIGVVLGQRGHSLVRAGLYAARQLADQVELTP
jgi:D-alanyl-D-alanine carboxypeptidase (penicillin-binding protein 5/6)